FWCAIGDRDAAFEIHQLEQMIDLDAAVLHRGLRAVIAEMGGDDAVEVEGGGQERMNDGELVVSFVLGVCVEDQTGAFFAGKTGHSCSPSAPKRAFCAIFMAPMASWRLWASCRASMSRRPRPFAAALRKSMAWVAVATLSSRNGNWSSCQTPSHLFFLST